MPPFLSHITNTFFTSLINRLGVRPPPPDGFDLINTVQPVSIVDADVALAAVTTTQLLDTPFTAGILAAPAAGTLAADTGAQLAGNYLLFILASAGDGVVQPTFELQRRDAANAANIWSQRFYSVGGGPAGAGGTLQLVMRVSLSLNERIRMIVPIAGGAGSGYEANIWLLAS